MRIPTIRAENLTVLADPLLAALPGTANLADAVGSVRLPVFVCGPLPIKGLYSRGDYYVPLATTEAATIRVTRSGMGLLAAAGGCRAMLVDEGAGRALTLVFPSLQQAALFAHWTVSAGDALRRLAARAADRILTGLHPAVEGNRVHLYLEFSPGDEVADVAVTAAVEAIHAHLRERAPIRPVDNGPLLSPTPPSALAPGPVTTGRRVCVEATIPDEAVSQYLGASLDRLPGVSQPRGAPAEGSQNPRLRVLTALFAACGQDLAAVPASAIGALRFEVTSAGDLYAGLTLESLSVGTRGGGTALPAQQACLQVLGVTGPDGTRALAEVSAAVCLAAEVGALGGTF